MTCEEMEIIYIIYLESPAAGCDADHVPVAHRGHGDHEEVDGIPVGEGLGTGELGKISRIFQLKEKMLYQTEITATNGQIC